MPTFISKHTTYEISPVEIKELVAAKIGVSPDNVVIEYILDHADPYSDSIFGNFVVTKLKIMVSE